MQMLNVWDMNYQINAEQVRRENEQKRRDKEALQEMRDNDRKSKTSRRG